MHLRAGNRVGLRLLKLRRLSPVSGGIHGGLRPMNETGLVEWSLNCFTQNSSELVRITLIGPG